MAGMLDGKIAAVTGAGSGIGREIAVLAGWRTLRLDVDLSVGDQHGGAGGGFDVR